jgi:hypothetical protein
VYSRRKEHMLSGRFPNNEIELHGSRTEYLEESFPNDEIGLHDSRTKYLEESFPDSEIGNKTTNQMHKQSYLLLCRVDTAVGRGS